MSLSALLLDWFIEYHLDSENELFRNQSAYDLAVDNLEFCIWSQEKKI